MRSKNSWAKRGYSNYEEKINGSALRTPNNALKLKQEKKKKKKKKKS
jgi:hypothetical protein